MRTTILTVVLFIAIFSASAQEKAKINFDNKKHDFGKIYQNKDSIAVATFYFENVGNTPLIILKVTTTCGCTVSEWTKSPIAKNEKGMVKITFHSKGITGKFSKSIYVKSNAENDVVILKVEGEVFIKKEKSIFDIFN